MSEEQLRQQLYDAFANRAHIYPLLFDQLRSELGPERARSSTVEDLPPDERRGVLRGPEAHLLRRVPAGPEPLSAGGKGAP
jgi:hypothetical protein